MDFLVSDQSGHSEMLVARFETGDARRQMSTAGGNDASVDSWQQVSEERLAQCSSVPPARPSRRTRHRIKVLQRMLAELVKRNVDRLETSVRNHLWADCLERLEAMIHSYNEAFDAFRAGGFVGPVRSRPASALVRWAIHQVCRTIPVVSVTSG
jgi:hypothetical protein